MIPADLYTFFDSYFNAFNRFDPTAVAEHYWLPTSIANDRGCTVFQNHESLFNNIAELLNLYRDAGYNTAKFEAKDFIAQGAQFAIVTLKWTILRLGNQPSWEFHTTYNLFKAQDDWKIIFVTAYEGEQS